MNRLDDWLLRLRDLLAPLFLAGALAAGAAGTVLVGPEHSDATEIQVAAFNIQVFGQTKRSNAEVMDVLVQTARQFDILAIQEVRDASETTADFFLDQINAGASLTYAMVEGPRLGRTSSKEQYVIYYVPAVVTLLSSFTLADPDDLFEREPLAAVFQAGGFDFMLVVCHIKPDAAEAELQALAAALPRLQAQAPGEQDLILMGDFNADGSYLNEDELPDIFAPPFQIVISDTLVTTTRTQNTYDRIILADGGASLEYVTGSAGVFLFDQEFGLTDPDFVRTVSDHYPVYANFSIDLGDDDP